jgi:hypothetical protein
MPQGAMYMVVKVDPVLYGEGSDDEMAFLKGLIAEESVYCLPGSALYMPGWIRLVLTYPPAVTRDACERIAHYCQRRLMTTASNDLKLTGEKEDRSLMKDKISDQNELSQVKSNKKFPQQRTSRRRLGLVQPPQKD